MNGSKATAELASWSVPTLLNTRHGPIEYVESGEGAAVLASHGAITKTTTYPLEQVAVPVLVVHGTEDRMVPFTQHGKSLGARIPGAQLLTVEGGEHMAIFTHREEVKTRVTQFLRDLALHRFFT